MYIFSGTCILLLSNYDGRHLSNYNVRLLHLKGYFEIYSLFFSCKWRLVINESSREWQSSQLKIWVTSPLSIIHYSLVSSTLSKETDLTSSQKPIKPKFSLLPEHIKSRPSFFFTTKFQIYAHHFGISRSSFCYFWFPWRATSTGAGFRVASLNQFLVVFLHKYVHLVGNLIQTGNPGSFP